MGGAVKSGWGLPRAVAHHTAEPGGRASGNWTGGIHARSTSAAGGVSNTSAASDTFALSPQRPFVITDQDSACHRPLLGSHEASSDLRRAVSSKSCEQGSSARCRSDRNDGPRKRADESHARAGAAALARGRVELDNPVDGVTRGQPHRVVGVVGAGRVPWRGHLRTKQPALEPAVLCPCQVFDDAGDR